MLGIQKWYASQCTFIINISCICSQYNAQPDWLMPGHYSPIMHSPANAKQKPITWWTTYRKISNLGLDHSVRMPRSWLEIFLYISQSRLHVVIIPGKVTYQNSCTDLAHVQCTCKYSMIKGSLALSCAFEYIHVQAFSRMGFGMSRGCLCSFKRSK